MTDAIQSAAIDRVLRAHFLIHSLSQSEADDAQERLASYINLLFSAGEHDLDRLTMCGIAYLRETQADAGPAASRENFSGL